MTKRVLLTDPIHERAMALLETEADAVIASAALPLHEQVAGMHGIIVRRLIGPEVVQAAESLEVIARHGVGMDFIPMEAATTRGIPVVYTPDANTDSVVEHTLSLMLALAKRLCIVDPQAKSGGWNEARSTLAVEP